MPAAGAPRTFLFRQLFDAATSTYTYLIADRDSGTAALVDPVLEQLDRDLRLVRWLQLELRWVVETHLHADHVTSASALRRRTGARIAASYRGVGGPDLELEAGVELRIGGLKLRALSTPGHAARSVSLCFEDRVLTGDALLVRTVGRCDLPGGDAGQLFDSVTERLFSLPEQTLVYPAHGYDGETCSTIGEEKRLNQRIAGRDRGEFVALMSALRLPPPKRLQEALARNPRWGA